MTPSVSKKHHRVEYLMNVLTQRIVKATDENLTSENWELILDVCDRVSANSSGPQQAIFALIKRLAHRNANVQLYTLELANALSQNCDITLHRELASKAFTDALLRLAADRNTHGQVKQKVMERMGTWSEQFRSSPELGIMEQAYQKLRLQQPSLMPPSKPVKKEISSEDRQKEDEELQMALALSIKDKGAASAGETQNSSGDAQQSSGASAEPQSSTQQGTTAATVSRVRALYDFTPSEPGELAFRKNDIIAVLESVYKDWWKGSLRGQTGIFPLNYVEKIQDPTKEELERDANTEAEVFGEIKNVERLLAMLSVGGESGGRRGEREEEEISELYQRTLSIRPKLIELIARYSQKKGMYDERVILRIATDHVCTDDFTQLNEKFIKARRDYEALLESSMSQPQYQQHYPYQQQQQRQSMYGAPPGQPIGHPGSQQPPGQAYQSHAPPAQQYPPQGSGQPQGYPVQQAYQQPIHHHLPAQQEPQRFYSPAPSETPVSQQTFARPYVTSDSHPQGPAMPGVAPFHFIPGGLQSAPLPPAGGDVRRQPSPQQAQSALHNSGPYNPPQGFQGQARPNSIHTLNSGNPSELATPGLESLSIADNRNSYPSAQPGQPLQQQQQQQQQMASQAPVFDHSAVPAPLSVPAQPQQAPPQPQHAPPQIPLNDRDSLPSRQHAASGETFSDAYAQGQPSAGFTDASQAPPSHVAGSSVPGQISAAPSATGPTYQAYNPGQGYAPPSQPQQGPPPSNDPGDYYR
jgi:signal transducing adaptor molecule